MDEDDTLILADISVESNTDEIDITRALEDELFAAIYHSAGHSLNSPDTPDANNFCLKDNTDSWQNIHPNSDGRLQTDVISPPGIGVKQPHESLGGKESHVRNVLTLNDWKESLSVINHSNKISTFVSRSNELDNAVVDTYREVISNTNLYNSEENLFDLNTRQTDSCSRTENIKRRERTRENKPLRGDKPKNWWSNDESDYSTDKTAYERGISSLETECYEKESEDKPDAVECKQSETWLTLSDISTCSQTTNSDESANIKPEERFGNHQPMTNKIVQMKAHKPPSSTAQKQVEQSLGVSNENSLFSSDFSCPESLVGENSLSSMNSQNTELISRQNDNGSPSISKNCDAIITLDDSEDSIFEIPVPPKPAPPTIDLEDSKSPTSFHDETSSNMSPEKLVETYRIALGKSMYDKTKPDTDPRFSKKKQSMNQKKTRNSPRTLSRVSPISDGNNDITQIPGQAIAAQSSIEQDIPTQVFSSDDRMSQVIEDANSQPSGSCTKDKDANIDNTCDVRDSPMSPELTSENTLSEVSMVTEQQTLETVSEMPLRKNRLTENANGIRPDTLIINATEFQSPQSSPKAKDRGETKSSKSLESRKRSIVDVEKRSKGRSPKKAKTSNESAIAASSWVIPPDESGTSEGNPQSRALDDFFKPMTEEMKNFYNNSWGRESFDIDAIRRDMPKDPRYWSLSEEDLLSRQRRKMRYWSHLRCKNCQRPGHRISECPEEKKPPACHMCGIRGHHKLACPDTMCLGCGTKQNSYTEFCTGCKRTRCTICHSIGHSENICPDLWRRFHHITSEQNFETQQDPAIVMKPANQLSCCNCARRGHDSTTCKDYRWSKYYPTPAYVTNYTSGPAYARDIILENVDSTTRTQKEVVAEEANEGFVADGTNTPGKRKKTKKNKTPDKNLQEDGNSRTPLQSIDKTTSKIKEWQKSQENACSATKEFITFQSPEFTYEKTKDFSPSEYDLTSQEYELYSKSEMAMEFINKLLQEYLAKLEFRYYTNGTYVLIITTTREMGAVLALTVRDFAYWRDDERNRFMNRIVSKRRARLVKILTAKLKELKQDLGDPSELFKTIQSLKSRLRAMELQIKTGEKLGTCSKRVKVVEELAKSQCRLNMILQTQGESHKYLKKTLTDLRRFQADKVSPDQYLRIIHHYNKVFAAYTPNNLKSLVDRYVKEQKTKKINCYDSPIKNTRSSNSSNISSRVRDDDSLNRITAASGKSLTFTIDNQVGIPTATFNNINPNMNQNQPPNLYEPMNDYTNPESDFYHSARSFRPQQQNCGNRYQDGWQQNHWAGFARPNLANNPRNFQPEFNRHGDYRSPMPRNSNPNIQQNTEYHFADDVGLNSAPNYISFVPGKTPWLDDAPQDILPNNIYFRDNQAGFSQQLYIGNNDTLSTSGVNSRAKSNFDDELARAKREQTKREKRERKLKRRAERRENNVAPSFLTSRAQKNIIKYKKEWKRPRIQAAVRRLQKQIDDNCLSLKSVRQFENLAKREMKSNVKKKTSD